MPPHDRRKDDVLIGRMDERLMNLNRAFLDHEKEDHARFELVFGHMKDRFDKVDKKLDTLWDQSQRAKGAFGASRLLGGAAWATIVLAIDWIIHKGTS